MSSSTDSLFARLHRAAWDGNSSALRELLGEDPILLERFGAGFPTETPLHIASLVGHVEFAVALLEKQPGLAQMRDEQGFYPLHLASAKGHVQVAKMMLRGRADLCKLRDKEARTPLHSAAANGQIDVLKELLSHVDEATARAQTERGETTLHLCVRYNQFEAAKFLVDKDKSLVNMGDDDGNTVLHLATARKQIQMLEIFLGVDGVDVEAENVHGFTALDVLVHGLSESGDIKIVEILENAGCKRATKVPNRSQRKEGEKSCWRNILCKLEAYESKQMRKNLLIAATLIATVTFTAGFSPPGGVWSGPSEAPTASAKDLQPGTAIFAKNWKFTAFFIFNAIAFMGSCGIILVLVVWVPCLRLRNGITTLYLTMALNGTILFLIFAFVVGAMLVSSSSPWNAFALSVAAVSVPIVVYVPLIFDGNCIAGRRGN